MASTINATPTSSGLIQSADNSGVLALQTGGTTAITIDTSQNVSMVGNLAFNSGYGSSATAYGCRSWVKFNGTGTVAILGSANVSSITDNGTGLYAVNFISAMPDNTYAGLASFQVSAWNNYQIITYGYSVGGYLIGTSINQGGAGVDNDNISSATFR
jgi:hypothetical protein